MIRTVTVVGCDIHFYAETRSETIGDRWQFLPAPSSGTLWRMPQRALGGEVLPEGYEPRQELRGWFDTRAYDLFGLLAGVRINGSRSDAWKPISEPRGWPGGLCSEIVGAGSGSCHSASYLLASEILDGLDEAEGRPYGLFAIPEYDRWVRQNWTGEPPTCANPAAIDAEQVEILREWEVARMPLCSPSVRFCGRGDVTWDGKVVLVRAPLPARKPLGFGFQGMRDCLREMIDVSQRDPIDIRCVFQFSG